MTTFLLIRHGRTTANKRGVLAGWTPGVRLDEVGEQQANELSSRLKTVTISHVVSSPLERTMQTAQPIAKTHGLKVARDRGFGECDYGTWTNKSLKRLARTPLWSEIQNSPSTVTFPEGESLLNMQTRAVAALHRWSVRAAKESKAPLVAVVSHGDVIKAMLAHALGMHLDMFQRIVVDPGSLSVLTVGAGRPVVNQVNASCQSWSDLDGNMRRHPVVGGGAGPIRTRG